MARHSTPNTLDDAIYHMVHYGKQDINTLADMLGWSASSLYRATNLHDDGAAFPVKRLTGSMIAQADFGPLRHMASRCGFVLYPVPKRIGRMQASEINELQLTQSEAIQALIKFFDEKATPDETRAAIDAAIGKLARGRKAVDHGIKQEELNL